MFAVLLMAAGNETTRNAMSGGMQLLIEHPEIKKQLTEDPSLIPAAVEEMLRLVTPVQSFSRTATRDVELGGMQIKQGDIVLMLYSSANCDPDQFSDPDRFIVDRKPNHLAFGIGAHFCLGANLARMELRCAFEEILRRMPNMEFSAGGPVMARTALIRNCAEMQVRFTPEAAGQA
jgi:cytochrome P450